MNALGFALVAATSITGLRMLLVQGTEKQPSYRTSKRAAEFVLVRRRPRTMRTPGRVTPPDRSGGWLASGAIQVAR